MEYILTVGRNERRFEDKGTMRSFAKTMNTLMPTVEITESQRGPSWHTDDEYLRSKGKHRRPSLNS